MKKRDTKRIPVSLEAELISNDISYPAVIGNISENGLYIIISTFKKSIDFKEKKIELKFQTSSGDRLNLHCKVKWSKSFFSNSLTKGAGLEIITPSLEYKNFYQSMHYKVRREISHNAIAVIGMACYYPGAPDLKNLWENILARRCQFRKIPDQRLSLSEYYDPNPATPDKTYASRAAVIDGFEFDWVKRGIPKAVVDSSDIAHWLSLEVSLKALEDAGYSRDTVPSDRSGVIVGNSLTGEHSRSEYMRLRWPYVKRALKAAAIERNMNPNKIAQLTDTMETYYKSVFTSVTEDTLAGNLSNTIAGRICNFLNLNGGGYTVDGACSSSLLAVADAATALSNGTLDLAVVGGVDISLDTFELIGFAKTNALTRKDMQVYDRNASGFIPGEGSGFVVLKRLEDAFADGNYVYAVLKGWGISSDGKGGITAPKAKAQALAILRAYSKAGYNFSEVDFIEGHGTGTPAGDKAELEGIANAMGKGNGETLRSCGITSLKSVIGHTKAASGIGGFIKAVMAVNRRVLPPTAGCREPNTVFKEAAHTVYPIMYGELRSSDDTLRAGISGMGFGGINCHVTIESADKPAKQLETSIGERELLASYQETEIFTLAAESVKQLLDRIHSLKSLVEGISTGEMVDLSNHLTKEIYTLLPFRAALIAASPSELIDCLNRLEQILKKNHINEGETTYSPQKDIWVGNSMSHNRIGFLFPGQGSQQLNMGRTITERYPWARDLTDRTDTWLNEIGTEGVSNYIYRPLDRAHNHNQRELWTELLTSSETAQPAICLTSLLWIRYLRNLGIFPAITGGHSLGELTAFHVAGALSEKELICLAAIRGQAMAARNNDSGTMASFACSQQELEELLMQVDGYAVVANINSPTQTVLSGEQKAVERAMQLALSKEIKSRQLPVSNAFHSRFVNEAAEKLRSVTFIPETLQKRSIKLFSSMGGKEVTPGIYLRNHFARQVVSQVDFISLINNMQRECDLFLEVGPGRVLSGLVQSITEPNGTLCFPVEPKAGDTRSFNIFLACYFVHGGEIKWPALFENRLVRPFIPASKRIFIDNPCERPFNCAKEEQTAHLSSVNVNNDTINSTGTLEDKVGLFSHQQLNFIRKLIHTEINKLAIGPKSYTQETLPETTKITSSVPDSTEAEVSSPDISEGGSSDLLLRLASEVTGFPKESLSLNFRLLDDLNLDSIKAGQFVGKALKLYGAEGKLDPTTMANDSLQEIYEKISKVTLFKAPLSIEREGAEVKPEGLLELASEVTGFPKESLSLNHRLLDDLNLDSIKAGQFVGKALKLYGAEGKLDPTTMANDSLQQIYDKIIEQKTSVQAATEQSVAEHMKRPDSPISLSLPKQEDIWVRYFKTVQVEQKLTCTLTYEEITAQVSEENRLVLIIADDTRDKLPLEMKSLLSEKNIIAHLIDYKSVDDKTFHFDKNIYYFIFLLPAKNDAAILSCDQAISMADRLHHIGTLITSLKMKQQKNAYAVIQFGNCTPCNNATDVSIESKGSTAFLSSVHLENPQEKIRVLEFYKKSDTNTMLKSIFSELAADKVFSIAVYDKQFVRHTTMLELAEPRTFKERDISWTQEDVILVTGGARGITAVCALALAVKTGVRLALVGRTVLIDQDKEIQKILHRYRKNKITYRYYACDISDEESLIDLTRRIEQDLGMITGVIHGAAMNKPRRVEQASFDDVIREIGPKLFGAINICKVLKNKPPKMFIGFSSIIGVTGMMGNAWYGFSNEVMNLLLQQFETLIKKTRVISIASSIWSDIGMGARMGSVSTLLNMGIHPIPSKKGVERFLEIVVKDPLEKQIVLSSRLGELSTLKKQAFSKQREARFLEEILYYEKGVEIEVKAVLTLDKDPYLKDHVFNGTNLFPTVFGLEAMAQAAFSVASFQGIDYLHLENVQLNYPITVSADDSTEIHIRALIQENSPEDDKTRVRVWIRAEQTGFKKDHFEATFILNAQPERQKYEYKIPETFLDIKPKEDLYGHKLFQGKMFQRIEAVRLLHESQCIFDSATEFHENGVGKLYIGDPFFRDTLLQSIQIILPDLLLPVGIEKWEIFPTNDTKKVVQTVVATLSEKNRDIFRAEVVAVDSSGNIIERLSGYSSKIVEKKNNAPKVLDLMEPDHWDEREINKKLHYFSEKLNITPPVISIKHQSGFHELEKKQRHAIEKELFNKAYKKLKSDNYNLPDEITVTWTQEGRPVVKETDDVGISCSHDDRLCLCVVGKAKQGCDVETITLRGQQEWRELLGQAREPFLKEVARTDKSLDKAGSRIWCAVEALRKATNMKETHFTFDDQIEDCLIFRGDDFHILTFPLTLLRGYERMVALAVEKECTHKQDEDNKKYKGENIENIKWGKFVDGGPQGQRVFTCQFPLILRDNATISGGVYFARYFNWLGKIREMTLKPIGKYISDEFFHGHFMATNYSETEISGDVKNHDVINARAWINRIFGYKDSSFILQFQWSKVLPGGNVKPVAFSEQQITWIRMEGHGVAESVECPEFFMKYLQKNNLVPKTNNSINIQERSRGHKNITVPKLGKVLYEENMISDSNNILHRGIFDTTIENSCLAQNIYFSNYFTWQGHIRDRYFFNIDSERFKNMDRNGQFVCLHSSVSHLREAIPFDRILVTMKLQKLYECGLDLYFDYFRIESDSKKVKLAYGYHKFAWVYVDNNNNYVPLKLPEIIVEAILNKVGEKSWTA